MTIFVCLCGKTKTDQPYNSANRHKWVCPTCVSTELAARELFDARPHRHPNGRIPEWDIQPEDIKEVFRQSVRGGMVDAGDLKFPADRRGGSSPSGRTNRRPAYER